MWRRCAPRPTRGIGAPELYLSHDVGAALRDELRFRFEASVANIRTRARVDRGFSTTSKWWIP